MAQTPHSVTAYAKTTQPSLGSVIARESLFARLDAAAGREIVWIAGRPGAGKTTLAASYIDTRKLRSIWLQVDADDSDPASFFHYLRHAARALGGQDTTELPAFAEHHNDDVGSFARNFFRRLFGRVSSPLVLVLDNLHAVPTESALYAALEAGFNEIPRHCTVVVTSRREPPPAFARLRAAGRLCCIGGNDLALSHEEVIAVASARGQSVSPEAAARLFERTQGWVAGLVLLLEHSRFSGRIADIPHDSTPQVIFDYLAGEIFDRFDEDTRAFLLRIACLPRMTAPVAEALSGQRDAARLLVNLALNDYFVRESSSECGRVYQLHPLLREFLRRRAVQAMPEAASGAWLHRAAGLLRQGGQIEDAIALLIEAHAWDDVARIALDHADLLLGQGRSATLAGWLDALPPAMLDADPRLLCASAAAHVHSSPRAARQRYERAFASLERAVDRAGMIESACGAIRCILREFDDFTQLDQWIGVVDALLGESPVSAVDVCRVVTLVQAIILRGAAHPRLDHWHQALVDTDATEADEASAARLARAWIALARGDLEIADTMLDFTFQAATDAAGAVALVRCLRLLVAGEYANAERAAKGAREAGRAAGIHAGESSFALIAVAARLSTGDRASARAELEELGPAALRRGDRACIHYVRGWIAALDGDSVAAYREGRMALIAAIETGFPWLESLARIALAHLAIGNDDHQGAEAQWRGADSIAQRSQSAWLRIGAALAAAALKCKLDGERAALDDLRAALRLGRERGLHPPPYWQPSVLADLVVIALNHGIETSFARSIVRREGLAPTTPPLRVREWPWRLRVWTLGGFRLWRDDAPIEFVGKPPGRPLELLKVLIALGCHQIRADQIADALWPEVEADYAQKSFTATLHRLRRLLGDDDALILSDGRLTLNKSLVWIDTWAMEHLHEEFDSALRSVDANRISASACECADALVALYRGPFLPDESEQPSFIACREQMRARVLRFLARAGKCWEDAGNPQATIDRYLSFIEVDEICEPLYRALMQCQHRSGSRSDALVTYERLRATLSARTKTMPAPETQALYARLKAAESPTAAL